MMNIMSRTYDVVILPSRFPSNYLSALPPFGPKSDGSSSLMRPIFTSADNVYAALGAGARGRAARTHFAWAQL
jgi:hypothetical protein